MIENNVKVLVVEPGREPYIKNVPNELKAMQAIVGGHLESVTIDSRLVLLCNENGIALDLPVNRSIDIEGRALPYVGTFFFVAYNEEGEFISLTDDDIYRCRAMMPSEYDTTNCKNKKEGEICY